MDTKPTHPTYVQPYECMETSFGSQSLPHRQSEPAGVNRPETEAPDPLLEQARTLLVMHQNPSVAFLQRHLMVDYSRATALMQYLEGSVVTAPDETGWRRMLASGQLSPDDPRYNDSSIAAKALTITLSPKV